MATHGIHHITAICSDPQKNLDFYTQVLGLRFVKKTVNFDSPDTYHFYFGNEKAEPGTLLTFFPFTNAGTGMRGVGQATKIYFGVPKASIGFWLERFITKGIKDNGIKTRFNESYITFYDPDGLQLEIVGTNEDLTIEPWEVKDIPNEHGLRGFFGAELAVESTESIVPLLEDIMDYEFVDEEGLLVRYRNKNAKEAKYLDLLVMHGWPEGIGSAGTNHHIAFGVKDKAEQEEVKASIQKMGYKSTDIVERFYFTSVYFREFNNILFEIATDGPGFGIDEEWDKLGMQLKLPPQYESQRKLIESVLPEVYVESSSNEAGIDPDLKLFRHKFVDNNSDKTTILFHGTGGDEIEMIRFAKELGLQSNILSIKGNTLENGMNRFFERYEDGSFNLESLNVELENLDKFMNAASESYKLAGKEIDLIGYSNGANFALSYVLSKDFNVSRVIALHPVAAITSNKILKDTEIIITQGSEDEYSSKEKLSELEKLIQNSQAKYTIKELNSGHEISDLEIEFIKQTVR